MKLHFKRFDNYTTYELLKCRNCCIAFPICCLTTNNFTGSTSAWNATASREHDVLTLAICNHWTHLWKVNASFFVPSMLTLLYKPFESACHISVSCSCWLSARLRREPGDTIQVYSVKQMSVTGVISQPNPWHSQDSRKLSELYSLILATQVCKTDQ